MQLTRASSYIFGFYIALLLLWFSASFFDVGKSGLSLTSVFNGFKNSTTYGYIFGLSYGFVPFFGGVLGMGLSKKWGMFASSMGKATFFLALSLIIWSAGSFIWSYYNFVLHTAVPYPGMSDVAWVSCYPFWALGVIFLGQATGVKFGLRKAGGKLFLIALPIAVLALSWYVEVVIARSGSITSGGGILKIFFDIAYPVGDVLILTLAALIYGLSFQLLGGKFKWPIFIVLLGFLVEYIADFGYTYTTTVGTYYNGGLADLGYTTSLFLMSFGLCLLDARDGV